MQYLDSLVERYPDLKPCKEDVQKAYELLKACFKGGHKLLIAGNGGSAADSDHIVGELMKGFKHNRKISSDFAKSLESLDSIKGKELANSLQNALPAISLSNHNSLNTAFANDVTNGGEYTFAQQLYGYGVKDDVFLAISTSGNSKNVYNACLVAKAKGLKIILLGGKDGGMIKHLSDVSIVVPYNETYLIQERHLPIYHCLCAMLEEELFD